MTLPWSFGDLECTIPLVRLDWLSESRTWWKEGQHRKSSPWFWQSVPFLQVIHQLVLAGSIHPFFYSAYNYYTSLVNKALAKEIELWTNHVWSFIHTLIALNTIDLHQYHSWCSMGLHSCLPSSPWGKLSQVLTEKRKMLIKRSSQSKWVLT